MQENIEEHFCLYCGVKITVDTALRHNGYCAPHKGRSESYYDMMPGEKILIRYYTQKDLERLIQGNDEKINLAVFFKSMEPGDRIASFRTVPEYHSPYRVNQGFVIIRKGRWINGFIRSMEMNMTYMKDLEEEVSLEKIKEVFSDEWEEIKPKLKDGDKFIHFLSKPSSWHYMAGREYYFIKRGEEIIFRKLTLLS